MVISAKFYPSGQECLFGIFASIWHQLCHLCGVKPSIGCSSQQIEPIYLVKSSSLFAVKCVCSLSNTSPKPCIEMDVYRRESVSNPFSMPRGSLTLIHHVIHDHSNPPSRCQELDEWSASWSCSVSYLAARQLDSPLVYLIFLFRSPHPSDLPSF